MYAVRLEIPAPSELSQEGLANIATLVERLAYRGLKQWLGYAQGAPLPDGQVIGTRLSGYFRSIQLRQIDDFHYEIFSDAPYAAAIERGTGQRDLKRILDTSFKVRVTRKGKRYLVIPFRWGTGTGSGQGVTFGARVMPPEIHDIAKELNPTRVVGRGTRLSGTGAWGVTTRAPIKIETRSYAHVNERGRLVPGFGGRLPAGLAPKLKPEHATDLYAGMVKFQHPTRGGSKDTHYLTFRTMVEGGRGWIVPPQPGKYPARAVADELNRLAPVWLKRALDFDRMRLVQP